MKPRPRRGLHGLVLAALVLLSPSLITDSEEAAAPQTEAATLSCALQHQPPDRPSLPCGAVEDGLPLRLAELLSSPRVSEDFRSAARMGNFGTVTPAVMADVPVLVLLHMSPAFLSTCTPRALSAIVRKHPGNPVVAQAVLSALDLVDNEGRSRFIRELGLSTHLGAEVEAAIGQAAVRWWAKEMKEHSMDLATAGSPLLAALPPGYLAELPADRAANMLMRLRNHPWETPNDPSWANQSPEAKRVWMVMFKGDPDSGKAQLITDGSDGLKMLWAGATPDEIGDLQYKDEDRSTLTQLRQLTKLQIRAFLKKLFTKSALSSLEMNEVFSWMLELAPDGLQRFLANDTDFTNLPSADLSRASLPTLKQVLEQVLANCLIQGRIEDLAAPASWGRNIKDVGRLVFLLRAHQLAVFRSHRLPADVLASIDTYELSAVQARHLTNDGRFLDLRRPIRELEGFHGLTVAIPTSTLGALRTSSVSNEVLYHLLESVPASNPGRSAVLFNKLRASLTDSRVLEAVLRNPQPSQYWSLVSSREVDAERADLERAFRTIKSPPRRRSDVFSLGDWIDANLNKKDDIEDHLRNVPVDTLSAVLGSARRELLSRSPAGARPVWTADVLSSPASPELDRPLVRGALLGLSCADLAATDLVDLPVVIATFNHRRQTAGWAFPKKLHHCAQRALEDYLDMKRRVRQFGKDVSLISVIEPSDIQAFGGYVLSTLRPEHIRESGHATQILSAIGALSPQELLSAVPSLERLKQLALEVVDAHLAHRLVGARVLFALGNLHMFLPHDMVSAIDPAAWKLYVEATAGRPLSLAVCAGSEQRDAWHRLAVRAFGSPSLWSPGVVAALGDALASLPADVMSSIRVSSWQGAADTLAERTVYHRATDVPGSDYPLHFVEVCRSLLGADEQSPYYWSARRTTRFYLRALQSQLDTVETADRLFRRLGTRSSRTGARGQAAATTPSTTTTTTTTIATTEETTTISSTTETTEDPFFDLDSGVPSSPAWLLEALAKATTPPSAVPIPDSVIVRDDADNADKVTDDASTATSSTATTTTGDSMTSTLAPGEDSGLVPWVEAKDSMPALKASEVSSAPTTTVWTENPQSSTFPAAMGLPSLAAYPNESAPGEQVNLSTTTTKYSADTDTVTVVGDSGSKPVAGAVESVSRRRRATDDAVEQEMEYQVAKDAHVQVTCDGIRALGGASALALVRGDAEHMLDSEVVDCYAELAALRLGPALTRSFWVKVPAGDRAGLAGDLGRLVSAIAPGEVHHLNLSLSHERVVDTLSVVGQHVTDARVLEAQNPSLRAVAGGAGGAGGGADGRDPVDADSLLVALGPLVCSLPLDVQRLLLSRRGALQHAARSLQGVRLHCNATCLEELARAAASDTALGDVATWTAEDVRDMGVIVAGLHPDQIAKLRRGADDVEQPISGLTASAVACMSGDHVQALGDHLAMLSPVTASAVTPLQQQQLSTTQEVPLVRVRNLAFTRHLGKPEPGDDRRVDGSSAAAVGPGRLVRLVLVALSVVLMSGLV
ncbi:hypothetical protein ONE63_005687 [Megalurothrips usitatus]|uniref:Otoancorin n=1 Tax=Megalurothrips usitatus TaxID=439358 RepID=A0AAV7Y097_9NEOP|nr:hypothetical protein ONE63_005687 [Megalurothrips usitatus]